MPPCESNKPCILELRLAGSDYGNDKQDNIEVSYKKDKPIISCDINVDRGSIEPNLYSNNFPKEDCGNKEYQGLNEEAGCKMFDTGVIYSDTGHAEVGNYFFICYDKDNNASNILDVSWDDR